jgi:hypothetical protein
VNSIACPRYIVFDGALAQALRHPSVRSPLYLARVQALEIPPTDRDARRHRNTDPFAGRRNSYAGGLDGKYFAVVIGNAVVRRGSPPVRSKLRLGAEQCQVG